MKRNAFGATDLLIGLLVVSAVFLLGRSVFRGNSTLKLNSVNGVKSIQEQVDETVNEIEQIRGQSIDLQNEMQSGY